MSDFSKDFLASAAKNSEDKNRFQILKQNIEKYSVSFEKGKDQFSNLGLARQRAEYTKWKALEDLDTYLIEFEANFIKKGGKVIWAQNSEEALAEIFSIIKKSNLTSAIKSKSMVTEEIGLNKAFEKKNIKITETDLGEFIQQLSGEPPFHVVTPAMHKTKEEISSLFTEKLGAPNLSSPEDIAEYARTVLRESLLGSDIGITGANFILADMGAISISENEGNALLGITFPKVHFVITGIEKVLPSASDLDLFWPLLSSHGTGQKITAYNHIISGPRQDGEADGPEEMYVVLLDNNRTSLLGQTDQRSALSCIKCGACMNVCPVYQHIGGHAYGTEYPGPIGSVITPFLKGKKDYSHLSYASTLCGKCTEVCPVNIELHKLLLYNRRDAVEKENLSTGKEKIIYFAWKKAMLKRSSMNQGGAKTKNFILENFFKKSWGERRELPKVAPKSFNELWKEQHKDLYQKK